MNKRIAQAKVIATSVVTWAMIGVIILQALVAEVANAGLSDGATEAVAVWGGRGIVILFGVISTIRRVMPVTESKQGILPQ